MRKVFVNDLEPGMVLATAVENADGYRILAAGTALNDNLIMLLKEWRVIDVLVREEEPVEEVETTKPKVAVNAAVERLKRNFEGRLTNKWMKALYDAAEKRLDVPRYWKD